MSERNNVLIIRLISEDYENDFDNEIIKRLENTKKSDVFVEIIPISIKLLIEGESNKNESFPEIFCNNFDYALKKLEQLLDLENRIELNGIALLADPSIFLLIEKLLNQINQINHPRLTHYITHSKQSDLNNKEIIPLSPSLNLIISKIYSLLQLKHVPIFIEGSWLFFLAKPLFKSPGNDYNLSFSSPIKIPGFKFEFNSISPKLFHRAILNDNCIKDLFDSKNYTSGINIQPMDLLELHQTHFIRIIKNEEKNNNIELISYAKVAGSTKALYGIPSKHYTLLGLKRGGWYWGDSEKDEISTPILFSSASISTYNTSEFRPKRKFGAIINQITQFIVGKGDIFDDFNNKSSNQLSISEKSKNILSDKSDKVLLKKAVIETIHNAINWYLNSGVILGDCAKKGVAEGFSSSFDYLGKKSLRVDDITGEYVQRADCTIDCYTAFYLYHYYKDYKDYKDELSQEKLKKIKKPISTNQALIKSIIDNIAELIDVKWQYTDNSIRRGLFAWFDNDYDRNVFYSDDNGRCIFSLLLIGMISLNFNLNKHVKQQRIENTEIELNNEIKRGIMGAVALKLTTGKNGHRYARIDLKDFYHMNGRLKFRNNKTGRNKYRSPHYEAWSFAASMYAAAIVKDVDIIIKISKAIVDYAKKFRNNIPKFKIEHSINDDGSKLLIAACYSYMALKSLSLNNPNETNANIPNIKSRNIQSLINSVKDLIQKIIRLFENIQDKRTGAIPERDPAYKRGRIERSNNQYGTIEASVYSKNDDTITDQLYSTPFIILGLYLAKKTGDFPESEIILNKLVKYTINIQIRSDNSQINGAWMRAFDYSIGEYFGGNGDVGWGAYSIESGWTVGPTITSLILYLLDIDPYIGIERTQNGDHRKIKNNTSQSLSSSYIREIKKFYNKELEYQIGIERRWMENTPPAIPRDLVKKNAQNIE